MIATSGFRASRSLRTCCVVATWLERPYFEAALADAPASAGLDASSATAATASVPVTRHLYMTASIWCETTQTEQGLVS